LGRKNQSIWNKSGKTQTILTKFGVRGQVRWWQRSGNFDSNRPFWPKWGLGRVLRSGSSFVW